MDYGAYSKIYDAEYDDYTDDIPFYVKMAKRCESPALELGCGSGRVLIPVAVGGSPVWGLDRSAEMLARCRSKVEELDRASQARITLVEGDMISFSLEQRFGLIYLPFREFMHLVNVEDQLACLDCVHRHLKPTGSLVINHYDIDLTTLAWQRGEDAVVYRQKRSDYLDPETGQLVLITLASTYQSQDQCLIEERFYDRLDDDGVTLERRTIFLTQRWFFRWEMEHLLARSGFAVSALYGGYHGEKVRKMGGELIWVARPFNRAELETQMRRLEERLNRTE